jgi:hypothetical protein
MFDAIRKGLTDSYNHKAVEGAVCVACGRKALPLALHVIEFYHPDSIVTPSYFVPMSQSRGTTRGSVPLCNICCPACTKCSLPIATPWVKKLLVAISSKHKGISFVIRNGFCRHIHPIKDATSLFRSTRLSGVDSSSPEQKVRRDASATNPKPIAAPRNSLNTSTPEQIGYLLSMLLTKASTADGAEIIAQALDYDTKGSVENRNKLARELTPLNTSLLITAANIALPQDKVERVINSFLASARATIFEDIESQFPAFPLLYQDRLNTYYSALSQENAPIAVSYAFMNSMGFNPITHMEKQINVSTALGIFMNSAIDLLKKQAIAHDA